MTRKKTTLNVDAELWRLAKVKATMEDKPLGDWIEGLIKKETKELASDTTLSLIRSKKRKGKIGVKKRGKKR